MNTFWKGDETVSELHIVSREAIGNTGRKTWQTGEIYDIWRKLSKAGDDRMEARTIHMAKEVVEIGRCSSWEKGNFYLFMNSNMVEPEKFNHLHLVYHFTIPLKPERYVSLKIAFISEKPWCSFFFLIFCMLPHLLTISQKKYF